MPKTQPVPTDPDAPIRVSDLPVGELGEFEGVPVVEARVKMTGADGFINETMMLAQVHLPIGARVYVLEERFVKKYEHAYPKVDGEWDKTQIIETAVLDVESALFLDPDLVAEVVAAHKARIIERRAQVERERQEAKGVLELPFDENADGATIHNLNGAAGGA
jgi:hypothetical protein